MKKKWKNLIVLCLAATLTCFLPVRIAQAVEDNGSLPSGASAEGDSNLMLEAAPEENCNLPLAVSVEDNSNPSQEGNGGIMPLDNEAGDGEGNGEGNSGTEEKLEFYGIRKGITYLQNVSFQVKGNPAKVTIKEVGQDGEGDVLTPVSNTYTFEIDGKKGTYIITAVRGTDEEEKKEVSCTISVNGTKQDGKIVLSSGTYALTTGQAYKLESGFGGKPWIVEGEGNHTVYYGGCSFYVSEAKDYHITTAGWGVW